MPTEPETVALEICVDAPDDLQAAIDGGADRIELCSALALGGLTPSPGLIEMARDAPIPVFAMIRPRGGDFCWTATEASQMLRDLAHVRAAGLAGVVIGASTDEGLDLPLLSRICRSAQGMGVTLHRVVDTLPDPSSAVGPAIALGIERILSSGGAAKAPDGIACLGRMVTDGGSRLGIMAGSGVAARHVAPLYDAGIRQFHASCSVTDPRTETRRLDRTALAELRSAIDALPQR